MYGNTKYPDSQSNLEKEEKARGIMLSDFKVYYKSTVTKRVFYWHKNRQIGQWNKIGTTEINWCTYGQLIYDKGGKNIQWEKTTSSINGVVKTGQLHGKESNCTAFSGHIQ